MSIVTLNKYLLSRRKESEGSSPEPVSGTYLDLASRIIASIRGSVLCGETFTDLFQELDCIRKDLHVETGSEIVDQCAVRLEEVLTTYQSRLRQAQNEQAADLRIVMDMLSETLTYYTTGSQQSEERRKQLENNLSTATRIDDISSLRTYLAKLLQNVRDNSRHENDATQAVIERLGKQIQQVQKAQLKINSNLPGRSEGLDLLKQLWGPADPPSNLYVAVFVADTLSAIRQRHGDQIANIILQEVGRKHLPPLVTDGQVFQWSADALILIWQHTDLSFGASDVSFRLKSPCEHRAFVGSRVAIFNLTFRSLVVNARDCVKDVEMALDRFVRRGGK